MKKFKIMAAAALLAVSTGASAQFTNSNTSATGKITSNSNGWSTFNVQYNPSNIKYDVSGVDDDDFTAFTLEWTQARMISSTTPIFIEYGVGVQYGFKSEDDATFSMLSIHAPVNLGYDFQIPNSSVAIDPFVGLKLRGNIIAQIKDDGETINFFDKDDMGDSDYTWNRFSIGWQIGLNARFNNKFMIGVSYGSDLNEIAKKTKIGQTSIKLGMVF